MPARSHSVPDHGMSAYVQVCRLSTRYERAVASVMVERLVDAGLSYAEAGAAVREQRALRWLDRAGRPAVARSLGRTRIARLALPCRRRSRS